ncbi:MAG: 3'-5' exonuclease [Flavobacteriales bacterium]|nr:3'-5' exonuclease [Flavobacteriales bacterium]
MLDKLNLSNVLFLDIETVPQHSTYKELAKNMAGLWDKKSNQLTQREDKPPTPEENYNRAGIYSEFGKIVCISVGMAHGTEDNLEFRLKSFANDNEKQLLEDFSNLLTKYYNKTDHLLCGHNAKEFDFPYICRRMLVHGVKLPKILDIAGKKPWEIFHLDTMELWKFGDYKHYTALNLLCAIFDIPTPKDDIDGSDVWRVYWQDKDLKRIATYCEKDVLTVAQLLLRFKNLPLIKPENVSIS